MPGMMHHNCSRGCCPRGSRTEDKRTLAHWEDDYLPTPHRSRRRNKNACPRNKGQAHKWQFIKRWSENPAAWSYGIKEWHCAHCGKQDIRQDREEYLRWAEAVSAGRAR